MKITASYKLRQHGRINYVPKDLDAYIEIEGKRIRNCYSMKAFKRWIRKYSKLYPNTIIYWCTPYYREKNVNLIYSKATYKIKEN